MAVQPIPLDKLQERKLRVSELMQLMIEAAKELGLLFPDADEELNGFDAAYFLVENEEMNLTALVKQRFGMQE